MLNVMEQLNNPFVIYGNKGAEYFCDRKKETEVIMKALQSMCITASALPMVLKGIEQSIAYPLFGIPNVYSRNIGSNFLMVR